MFISYAQNFEDIILWRALKNIEKGFYIDIGAQDPVIDSVSFAFYEQGWRGIHIEPVSFYVEKLRNVRPGEAVIQAVVGIGSGVRSFFEIVDTGLSTGDAQIAEKHAKEGFTVRETIVPCISLGDILDRYQNRDIHWLKIDVEGMEAEVVQSWHSSTVRPWIVVIESTLPNSQIESFNDWESLLFSLGYEFVYFDGLNRFYVSQNHKEFKVFFNTPPNYFDGFVLSGTGGIFCSLLNTKLTRIEYQLNSQVQNNLLQVQQLNQALLDAEKEKLLLLANHEQVERELNSQVQNILLQVQQLNQALLYAEKEKLLLSANHEQVYREATEKTESIVQTYEHDLNSAKIKIDKLNSNVLKWQTLADSLNNDLQNVYKSRSWRITTPMRIIIDLLKWFMNGTWAWLTFKPGSRPHRIARRMVFEMMSFGLCASSKTLLKRVLWRGIVAIKAKPGLRRRIVSCSHKLGLYPTLCRLYHRLTTQRLSTLAGKSADPTLYGDNQPLKRWLSEVAKTITKRLVDQSNPVPEQLGTRIILDISTSLAWRRHAVGVLRVEHKLLFHLLGYFETDEFNPTVAKYWGSDGQRTRVTFCHFNKSQQDYYYVSAEHAALTLTPEWTFQPGDATDLGDADIQNQIQSLTSSMWGRVPVAFGPDDIYISVGADWDNNNYTMLYDKKSVIGFKVVLCCFDLIPILFPHLTLEGTAHRFRQHVVDMCHTADTVLSISEATSRDLQKFITEEGLSNDLQIQTVILGDDDISLEVVPISSLKGKDFFLYVSTIEARKNHSVLLKAWELLADDPELKSVKLVLVGMLGWGTTELVTEIWRNPRLLSRTVLLNNLPDAQLNWLYANTQFTVFPSVYEGWGLPAAESLRWGKAVIISDAPALAEATQGLMPILRSYDVEGWQKLVRRLLVDDKYRCDLEEIAKSSYRMRTWDAYFDDVMKIVLQKKKHNEELKIEASVGGQHYRNEIEVTI